MAPFYIQIYILVEQILVYASGPLGLAFLWLLWSEPRARRCNIRSKWFSLVRSLQVAEANRYRARRGMLNDVPRRLPASMTPWWSCFQFVQGGCCFATLEDLGQIIRRRQRDKAQREVFRLCDQDDDGVLNQWEMLSLAREAGFYGHDKSWDLLYTQLCFACGRRPEQGIHKAALKSLLDDETDRGFHCSDVLLETMVRNLLYTVPNRRRGKLKSLVFSLCDKDGDGVLNCEETLRWARACGFDGNKPEWNEEFQLVCAYVGRSTAQGIDLVSLMRLLDDRSASGCYCDDDELESWVRLLHRPVERACTATMLNAERAIGEVPLRPGWRQAVDPASGRKFYWAVADPRGTTTWSRPRGFGRRL